MRYNVKNDLQKSGGKMSTFAKKQSPVRVIALGFLLTILIGSVLLMFPFSLREGKSINYIDSLYTATTAVCVTGLTTTVISETFSPIGQVIIGVLIQIGGLGVSCAGAGVMLILRKKMDLKERNLIKTAMNLNSGKGIAKFVREIFIITVIIELIGAALSFAVFIKDYDFWSAIGKSLFHSVSSFNNSGLDILGSESLISYKNNVLLTLITTALIFFGGIGFLVIGEILTKKFRWKKYSMHAKVVISMSVGLIILGTLLLKLSEGEKISWLSAFFMSVSARTAGFASTNPGLFSNAGIIVALVLMFIGASPGSTGGGVKTSTVFVLLQNIKAAATNKSEKAFRYSIPKDTFKKAAVVVLLGLMVVIAATFFVSLLETEMNLRDLLFEMTSAYSTAGLSTGITSSLSTGAKIVSILVMYIGRLGPLTVASFLYFSRGETFRYPEGNIAIG